MADSQDNLFKNPDMVVSLLLPNTQNETPLYKYLKETAKEYVLKSNNPSEFARLINEALSRETSRTRREALFHLKERATQVFALDEY